VHYFYPDTVTWAFGTQAAAVEVDVETCEIRLLAYAIVHDPGRAINPTIVEASCRAAPRRASAPASWKKSCTTAPASS